MTLGKSSHRASETGEKKRYIKRKDAAVRLQILNIRPARARSQNKSGARYLSWLEAGAFFWLGGTDLLACRTGSSIAVLSKDRPNTLLRTVVNRCGFKLAALREIGSTGLLSMGVRQVKKGAVRSVLWSSITTKCRKMLDDRILLIHAPCKGKGRGCTDWHQGDTRQCSSHRYTLAHHLHPHRSRAHCG